MSGITMRQLLEAGVHFGHRTRFWSPKMAPYIFGERNNLHIINLERTLPLLIEAQNFLGKTVANRGKVLFVGTKRAARDAVTEAATRCRMPYVSQRWLGGMLTNFKTVRQSVTRLKELEATNLEGISKKETLGLTREIRKLNQSLGGIKDMAVLPDALFVIDVGYENIAVKEAQKLGIPVVAVVDSNNAPDNIDYIIPGNDDAMRAIRLYTNAIADAVIDGQASLPQLEDEMDDFVELDESGRPITQPGTAAVTTRKRATKAHAADDTKKSPKKDAAVAKSKTDDTITIEAPVEDKQEAQSDENKKAVASKKKVTIKKKVVTATKKAATKKTATKKAATKKAATKKKTASAAKKQGK